MKAASSQAALVALLQEAYSGEMAAAYAYRGHWRSLRDPAERETVARIEREEWDHRRVVGGMLSALGASPSAWREAKGWLVGRALGPLCSISGRFLPMYFAWQLEVQNVDAYEAAARHSRDCGRPEFVPELARMSEVEREHEQFFALRCGRRTP